MSVRGRADALKLVTCPGDASGRVEDHGGTKNVAHDRAT